MSLLVALCMTREPVATAAGDRVVTRASGTRSIINVLHHLVNELCRTLAHVGELLDAGFQHERRHHWGRALRPIICTKCHKRSTGCQRNGVVVSSRDPNAEGPIFWHITLLERIGLWLQSPSSSAVGPLR